MLLEEDVERGEAAQHVLGQVGPVDPQDQVLAPPAQDLGSCSATPSLAATRSKPSASIASG